MILNMQSTEDGILWAIQFKEFQQNCTFTGTPG